MTERVKRRRIRKFQIDDHLVELFRRALPAHKALWHDACVKHDKDRWLTTEEHAAACEVRHAFNNAADVRPWEHGPLDPQTDGERDLRAALLAEIARQDRSAKT
jgi:hypothetical protein